MNSYLNTLKNLGYYNRRLSRSDFLVFVIANGLFALSLTGISAVINAITMIFFLVTTLFAAAQRLNDVGVGKKWLLLMLIPYVGQFLLAVWVLMAGHPATTRHGPYVG